MAGCENERFPVPQAFFLLVRRGFVDRVKLGVTSCIKAIVTLTRQARRSTAVAMLARLARSSRFCFASMRVECDEGHHLLFQEQAHFRSDVAPSAFEAPAQQCANFWRVTTNSGCANCCSSICPWCQPSAASVASSNDGALGSNKSCRQPPAQIASPAAQAAKLRWHMVFASVVNSIRAFRRSGSARGTSQAT